MSTVTINGSGELALIEANSPYACGWYGKVGSDSHVYVEWLISGWNYLNQGIN